jgi:hypothetical protein
MKINLNTMKVGRHKIKQFIDRDGSKGNYYIEVKFEKVEDFYLKLRRCEQLQKTNFGLHPYSWAAFGHFAAEGKLVIISSPKAKNGDTNWNAYKCYDKVIVPISICK